MRQKVALVTGFEPYAGRGFNPSGEVASRLDGTEIGSVPVVGRTFPVSFRTLRQNIEQVCAEVGPAAVVSLGLWPGEPTIRLERVAVNVADFEIPDNESQFLVDQPLAAGQAAARFSTLPLRDIERALLEAGIPARISNTAGTFLCNATMYSCLASLEASGRAVPCGFIHVPYLPHQVAALIADNRRARTLELHQRADVASMSLEIMIEAVRIALRECVRTPAEAVS